MTLIGNKYYFGTWQLIFVRYPLKDNERSFPDLEISLKMLFLLKKYKIFKIHIAL